MNIAIIEDDKRDRLALKTHLEKIASESGFDMVFAVFEEAESFLEQYNPVYDVVFMDIELPMMSGMDAAALLRQKDSRVILIFVTNISRLAAEGYKVNALDFIVKPYNYDDIKIVMRRAFEIYEQNIGANDIFIRTSEGFVRISLNSIKYIEVFNHKLVYHIGHKTIESRGQLKEAEDFLLLNGFYKCSRCYLINMRYVRSVSENVVDVGGECLQISRRIKKSFLIAIADFLGRHKNV